MQYTNIRTKEEEEDEARDKLKQTLESISIYLEMENKKINRISIDLQYCCCCYFFKDISIFA
jgi:hypothetical protein